MVQEKLLLALCAMPSEAAAKIASELVEKHLAACVNIVSDVTSVYFWQGRMCSENEKLLIIKSTAARWLSLQEYITEHHPYQIPELIAWPLSYVLPSYADWAQKEMNSYEH